MACKRLSIELLWEDIAVIFSLSLVFIYLMFSVAFGRWRE